MPSLSVDVLALTVTSSAFVLAPKKSVNEATGGWFVVVVGVLEQAANKTSITNPQTQLIVHFT